MGTVDYRCAELPRTRTQINRKQDKKKLLLGNNKSKLSFSAPTGNKASASKQPGGNGDLQELLSQVVQTPKLYLGHEKSRLQKAMEN